MACPKSVSHEEHFTGNCYIGIDVGTQGTKAIIYHPSSGTTLGTASSSYNFDTDGVEGRAEQHPVVWVDAVKEVLIKLASSHSLDMVEPPLYGNKLIVKGIGVSGQQHGMVVLDDDKQPIRKAKLWCDVEAAEEARELSELVSKVTGRPRVVPAGYTAPKVLWLKKQEHDSFEKMKHCVLPHDYITFLMGGEEELVTDAGDASGTGIFDTEKRAFDRRLADCIDGGERYFNSLPRVAVEANEVVGLLSQEWKKDVGIDVNNTTEIIISAGSGDNMCSALGCGCVEPGMVVLSLGTSGTIFGISLSPVDTTISGIEPFCDATGHHLPLVCKMSCTGVLQAVLDHWCSGIDSHEEASLLAEKEPPGCHGLIFLPFLGGERSPNWPNSTGSLLGLNQENMSFLMTSPGLMYRVAMEGITFNLLHGLEVMKEACGDGFKPKQLLVVGGGSKNSLWRQMLADILGIPLRFPTNSESAALGAAFQAGAAECKIPVNEYVSQQCIPLEDIVIHPTLDSGTLALYRQAKMKYQESSERLFRA